MAVVLLLQALALRVVALPLEALLLLISLGAGLAPKASLECLLVLLLLEAHLLLLSLGAVLRLEAFDALAAAPKDLSPCLWPACVEPTSLSASGQQHSRDSRSSPR